MSKTKAQQFVGVSNTLTVVDGKAYAYSGVKASAGSASSADTKMLEFVTPDEVGSYIIAVTNNGVSSTADHFYKVNFNGVTVQSSRERDEASAGSSHVWEITFIIPPRTLVECYADTSADPYNFTWIVAGNMNG